MPTHSRNDADLETSPQSGSYRNGEVNTTYLIWDGQIVDANGDPAEVVMYVSVQCLLVRSHHDFRQPPTMVYP